MAEPLVAGMRHEASVVVVPELTAPAFVAGTPAAFATPALVALIERTAAELVGPALAEGETTVGTSISLRHMAATPVGMTVRCIARLTVIERRRLVFEVEAWDASEKIGEASHERFIVSRDNFTRKLSAKGEASPA